MLSKQREQKRLVYRKNQEFVQFLVLGIQQNLFQEIQKVKAMAENVKQGRACVKSNKVYTDRPKR